MSSVDPNGNIFLDQPASDVRLRNSFTDRLILDTGQVMCLRLGVYEETASYPLLPYL